MIVDKTEGKAWIIRKWVNGDKDNIPAFQNGDKFEHKKW